jgi:hypothetical protein
MQSIEKESISILKGCKNLCALSELGGKKINLDWALILFLM